MTEKTFYQQDNIGTAKYTISFHNGVDTHRDGSRFFAIKIFKNKKDLKSFKSHLISSNYVEKRP